MLPTPVDFFSKVRTFVARRYDLLTGLNKEVDDGEAERLPKLSQPPVDQIMLHTCTGVPRSGETPTPVGPYSSPMPRDLWRSWGGGCF